MFCGAPPPWRARGKTGGARDSQGARFCFKDSAPHAVCFAPRCGRRASCPSQSPRPPRACRVAPGEGGCEQRHRSAERACAGVNLGNSKPDPMCCSMLRASSCGVSPCHVAATSRKLGGGAVGDSSSHSSSSYADERLSSSDRTRAYLST